ncbi:MAG TPA: CHAT domain-containing protein [Thermoanaerobaculia bacterium]|nr:CHAT domain-containing protein [Thermoanaerobaculia bacterium]
MKGWGLPWLLLGLAGNVIGPGADLPFRIQANAPLTRALSSGEVHVYRLTLDSGDYARVEVAQEGLDVAAALRGPSGAELVKVDSPTGSFSTESVSLIAEEKGDYSIEVRTVYPGDTGQYRLSLAALHRADRDDRLRVEAEQADLKAGLRARRGDPESIEVARIAIERWRTLGDRLHEARALTGLGKVLAAARQWEESLAACEQALSLQRELNDREGMADTLGTMGRTLRLVGDDRRALGALEESLTLWQELGRPDLAATALLTIGHVHQSFGDAGAALAAYERGLELSRKAGDRPQQSMALNSVGQMRFLLGRPLQALDDLRGALDLARSTGRRKTEAQVLSNLGTLYNNLGMPHDALEHFAGAREILRALNDTESEAIAINNLGMLLFQLGAYDEARELLGQALPLQHDPRRQAMTLVGLSRIAEELGETGEAATQIDRALKLQREAKDRAGEAESLRAQGLLLLELGDPAQAEARLRESLALYEELGSKSGASTARRGLARACAVQGKLDAARDAYEKSNREAESLGDIGAQVLILADQGRLEHEAGNLPAARERLEAALVLMESFRSEVSGDRLRAMHFATVRETYERYADVLMQLHQTAPGSGLDAKAFAIAEQSRARGLLDVLARARVDTRDGDPKVLERELRLRQELNAKAALRLSLADDEASRARSEALREEIDALTAEHQIVDALLADGSRHESLKKKPSLSVREIQGLLDDQTVLIEYLLADPRSYMWVVSSTSLQAFTLPGRKEIGPLARRLHERLQNPSDRDVAGQKADLRLLSQQVLGPALEAIAGRRLVIVPDGALHYIPFAALPVPRPEGSVSLVEEHEIVLLPSVAVLKEIRQADANRAPRPPSLAILADPVYNNDPSRGVRPRLVASRDSGLADLPWSRREAEGIKAEAQGREVLVALGAEATKDLVTSGRLDRFSALHFATHGILDSEYPQLSGLALSQLDGKGQAVNGFLSLQDLYSLRLQSDLVVLSGCKTGLGRELRGEGLVGLTNGFFHAGASQVVASLWPVRDRAAAEIMQRFYRSMLRDGLRPAAALRAAQIEMMNQRVWRDPYFWAAFVAQGDWTAGF